LELPKDFSYRMKGALKEAAARFGIDLRIKRDPLRFLRRRGIRTVLDIGANEGQFAREVRSTLPTAAIYSFEPLPGPVAKMRTLMRGDRNFEAFQLALGDKNGWAEFEENDFSAASSLLPVAARTLQAWPQTAGRRKTTVEVQTLDSWAEGRRIEGPYLVKLDVQGYEDKVIEAGRGVIRGAEVVISEVSFVELYKNQALFDTIHRLMAGLGFRLQGMIQNGYEPASGEILSADAIFVTTAGAHVLTAAPRSYSDENSH
jgi:FkbM family methyltransferase